MLPKIISPINTKQRKYEKKPINSGFVMRFDGCSKSNPGISGAGAVIYHDNDEIWAEHFFVGENATNNHAEYAGLILGLQQADQMNIKNLLVEGDSLLVINQMIGKFNCNSLNLIDLYDRANELSNKFDSIKFNHIYRNENKRADQLSNIAVEKFLEKNKECID
jgi:ribonuclease HI